MITEFITTWATIISIIIRVISSLICLFFVVRLQLKEAQVKNGLRRLRILLLAIGLILFHTHVLSLFFLTDMLMNHQPQKLINASLQIINAVSFLAISILAYFVYTGQYSDDSKEMHQDYENKVEARS